MKKIGIAGILLSLCMVACSPVMAQEIVEDAVEQLDPLKQALADTISRVTAATGEAVDFLQAEIPEVIRQLLVWKMAESLLNMFAGFAVAGLLTWIACRKIPNYDEDYTYAPPSIVPKCVLWFISFVIFMTSIELAWLQIWLAPKVYLIEYASKFL